MSLLFNAFSQNNLYSEDDEYDYAQYKRIHYTRPIAVKTNMLFDIATMLNVELEVPLGRKFSVAGEWVFPWWYLRSEHRCLHLLSGTLEGRYWFPTMDYANNSKENPLHGLFVGIYTGTGLYDLMWDDDGRKGEFYIPGGVSVGFAHSISRTFSMEYSLGIGYFHTKYKKFRPVDDLLICYEHKTYSGICPSRLKVSLVWRPQFKKKKGDGY